MRYTKKLPYTDLAVQAWHFYFNFSGDASDMTQAQFEDKSAVANVLEHLSDELDGADKTKLLRKVYGVPRRDSVGSRVLCAALDLCISEQTAWGWIKQANRYWAEARGVV